MSSLLGLFLALSILSCRKQHNLKMQIWANSGLLLFDKLLCVQRPVSRVVYPSIFANHLLAAERNSVRKWHLYTVAHTFTCAL